MSYTWDKDKQCFIQQNGNFLAFTHTNPQKATIGTVKSTLKIPPRHNGVVPIKISGQLITTHTAHFIMDDSTPKGRDPNINIIDGIHKIKDRSMVNILVSNYTNKHLTFHNGEYIGHLELIVLDSTHQRETHQANSITLKKMMSKTITPDTFDPPQHKLSAPIQDSLKFLLQEHESQFAKDKTSIGTTPLTSITIDTGTANPVSQKPYPIAMKHYEWVKDEIEKLLTTKVIHTSCSSWSVPIIVVPKGDGGKHLIIDYRALNKVNRKFTWPMPKVEDIFSKLNGATYFTTLDLCTGYHHIPLDKSSIPKTAFNSPFGKYEYVKVLFRLSQAPAYFQERMTSILKDFPFAIAYLDDIIIFSKTPQEPIPLSSLSQNMPKFLMHSNCCMISFPIFRLNLPAVSKFFLVPSTKNSVLSSFSFKRLDFIQDLMSLMQFSRVERQVSRFAVVHTSPPWIFAQDIITFPWINHLYQRQHLIHPSVNMNM